MIARRCAVVAGAAVDGPAAVAALAERASAALAQEAAVTAAVLVRAVWLQFRRWGFRWWRDGRLRRFDGDIRLGLLLRYPGRLETPAPLQTVLAQIPLRIAVGSGAMSGACTSGHRKKRDRNRQMCRDRAGQRQTNSLPGAAGRRP